MSGGIERGWVNVTVPADQLDELEELIGSADLRDIATIRVGWPRSGAHRAQLRLTGDRQRIEAAMRAIADTEIIKAAVVEGGERRRG